VPEQCVGLPAFTVLLLNWMTDSLARRLLHGIPEASGRAPSRSRPSVSPQSSVSNNNSGHSVCLVFDMYHLEHCCGIQVFSVTQHRLLLVGFGFILDVVWHLLEPPQVDYFAAYQLHSH
jgi:hypothetical protein